MAEDWKSATSRSRTVQQITELIRLSPSPGNKNANDLENQVFMRCKKKEDYLTMIGQVMRHLKATAQPANQSNPHLAAMLGQGNTNMQGQQSQGQVMPGQMVQGQMAQGQMNQGQMAQGQMNQGQMSQGQMSQGQMNQGQMSQGQMSQGQMSQGQMSQGQMSQGQMSQGQMSQSQMTQGQMNQSQMTQGQMNQSQMNQSQMNQGQMNQGQMNQGQMTPVQMNQSQMSQSQMNQGHMNQTQMTQGNQQMQMGVQMSPQQQLGQGNQMGTQQISQVGQMNNTLVNNQLGQGQMVGHGPQNMTGMGAQMGMGGVSASHGQAMGMSGQANQMGSSNSQPGQIGLNRMGTGNPIMGQMVGQTASSIGMGGGQVITNINNGMMGPNQGMIGNRMAGPIGGVSGQGSDMSWQGGNSHMLRPGMNNMTGKMGNIQMPISGVNQMGVGMMSRGAVSTAGSTASVQPKISSPSYTTAQAGNIPRQNIPCSVSITSPISNMGQNNQQPQLMAGQQSPAFIAPSPSSTMVPSPAGSGGRGSVMGAPSPSTTMINTPGQPMQQQSPASASQSEDAYLEKWNKLQKYVEPLKKLTANCGNEEGKMNEAAKMKKLLNILQNPRNRMPMETLERCEGVLEKLDLLGEKKESEAQPVHKESAVDVLMQGIKEALNAPNSAHVFYKTIAPAVEKLTDCIIPVPPPLKKRKTEEPQKKIDSPKINYIIQREVARLSQRFKVNLDSNQPTKSDDLTMICELEDPNLPCVPPLNLVVPSCYPELNAMAKLSKLEYEATDFLKTVQENFLRRQNHLPVFTSISVLLDTWEQCIRQACSPNASKNPDAVSPITAVMELMNDI